MSYPKALGPAASVGMWKYKRHIIWEDAVALLREGMEIDFSIPGCHSQGREVCGVSNCTRLFGSRDILL